MNELKSRLSTKGQVTIPQDIRTMMGLQPGDAVVFSCEQGHVELQRATSDYSTWSMAGALDGAGKPGKRLTIDEMDAVISRSAAKGMSR